MTLFNNKWNDIFNGTIFIVYSLFNVKTKDVCFLDSHAGFIYLCQSVSKYTRKENWTQWKIVWIIVYIATTCIDLIYSH